MAVRKFLHFWLCFASISVLLSFNSIILLLWLTISSFLVLLPLTSWLMAFSRKYVLNPHLTSKGKAVLITGCDSGLGFELAERLCELGYRVFASCLDVTSDGAKILKTKFFEKLHVLPLDVRSDQQVQNALQYVKQNLNDDALWAVVNNAGVAQAGEIEWTPMDEFQKVHEVNSTGTVRVTKAFLPLLRQSKGRVINNTSFCAHLTFPGYVGYCMSKISAAAFTTGLRIEMVKWGVKSISIEAFFYKTPLTTLEANQTLIQSTWDRAPDEVKEAYGKTYIEAFKNCCARLLKRSSSHNSEVIDSMVDAIASTDPLNSYFPCYFPHKVLLSAGLMLPRCVLETYLKLQICYGVKPKGLNKITASEKVNSNYTGQKNLPENGSTPETNGVKAADSNGHEDRAKIE